MKTIMEWKGGYMFEGKDESGRTVLFDHPGIPEPKGLNPLSCLLMGLGGCLGLKAMIILEKMKMEVTSFSFEITAEQEEEEPQAFTKIDVIYKIDGKNLKEEKVKHAIDLAVEKYCPAVKILVEGTPVEVSSELV